MSSDRERASKVLSWIVEGLEQEERAHFGLEILDAVRKESAQGIARTIESWAATVLVREHPDYLPQTKEYHNLRLSGELYAGVDLGEMKEASDV